MHIGDHVMLKATAATGCRRELLGEIGKVGDVWEARDGTRCTVVYEDWGCLVWRAPASDFEPAAIGVRAPH